MKIRLLSAFVLAASGLAVVACGDDDPASPSQPTADAGLNPTNDGGSDTGTTPDATSSEELPTGLQVAVPYPALGEIQHLSMVLDDQGDPIISYSLTRQTPGTSATPTSMWFTRWSRKTKGWAAPVKVDDTGNIEENDPHRETSIAFDPVTKTIGIAYQGDKDTTANSKYEVRLALSSDGGQTFTKEVVSELNSPVDAHGASLVMRNSAIHIVYTVDGSADCGGLSCGYYVTRAALAGPGFPTRTSFQIPAGTQGARIMPTDIALDSAGNPGFVYFVRGPQTYESQVLFARPGAVPVQVMTSQNIQNDVVNVSLAFDGTKPRVAAHLKSVVDAPYDMQFATSDDGAAWNVAPLPRSNTHATSVFQSMSIANGETVVAANFSSASDKGTCGGPKILRSKAGGAFDVGCTDNDVLPSFAGRYATIRHRADGKLVMAFVYTPTDNTKLTHGLIVWREK